MNFISKQNFQDSEFFCILDCSTLTKKILGLGVKIQFKNRIKKKRGGCTGDIATLRQKKPFQTHVHARALAKKY
jgi:hypothetical protein